MERAVITGATGMIGSTLLKLLVSEGVDVYAIVRPNSKKISNLQVNSDKLHIVECDMENLHTLENSDFEGVNCDTFFHFAWGKTYGSGRDDVDAQESNIRYTLDAVNLAEKLGVKTFVGAGSQAEFGRAEGKLSDTLPKNPVTGYGIAKLAAGRLALLACKNKGIRFNWGRILSCYGPGDNDYTMVMSAILTMARGEHMSFTPGEQDWDYIYSVDCARAFKAIGEKGVDGKIYTIGSGSVRKLKDYILLIRDAVNPTLGVGIGEREYFPNQVMHLEADISELTQDTGFVPEYSFEDGIKETVDWVRNSSK